MQFQGQFSSPGMGRGADPLPIGGPGSFIFEEDKVCCQAFLVARRSSTLIAVGFFAVFGLSIYLGTLLNLSGEACAVVPLVFLIPAVKSPGYKKDQPVDVTFEVSKLTKFIQMPDGNVYLGLKDVDFQGKKIAKSELYFKPEKLADLVGLLSSKGLSGNAL